ncbi:MAG: nodulation protein [Rhodospirillaceae bacterium]|jgi:nodulation protein E|nr:nodulation protein [Rhodospirillaceae bacterium]
MTRRVVITGYGAVSPLGHNAADTWAGLCAGRSAIGPIVNQPTDRMIVKVAGEVRGFDPTAHFDSKRLPLLDRFSQFALLAAREALKMSGLSVDETNTTRIGVVVGSGAMGMHTLEDGYRRLYEEGNWRLHPLTVPRLMTSAPSSQIAIEFKLRGPSFSVSSACASANHGIAQALSLLRNGQADAVLAGGTEAPLSFGCLKAWEALRVMAQDTCRPFSKDRRGMVMGEGGAMFVLETVEHAHRRGATIFAEIAGAGMSSDAGDIVLPDAAGAARAMSLALADAGLTPEDIGYINAHGTGTPANDPMETDAIRRVFGDHARRLLVSSSKSMLGHALGASGALELLATIKAIETGIVPPTANFTEPDPACDLDYVPNVAREQPVRAAISNSFAFGGLNAVLALRKFE